nr:hypothetical protein [Nocardia niigatensis]
MLFALDIRYEVGDDHPLSGYRVPDVDLTLPTGGTRVHELLRSGRPVLLTLNGTQIQIGDREDRVDVILAHCDADR